MPLNLHVPLPGPFAYSKRIGGGGAAGGALWVLFVGIWWVPLKYLVLALVWMCLIAYKVAKAGVLMALARQQQSTTPGRHRR